MGFLVKLLITLLGDLWWVLWTKGRAVKATRALAAELKFTPGGFGERWEEWEIVECFDGQLEGLSTAFAIAWRYKEIAETKMKDTALLIKTKTPGSLAFHYELGRPMSGISGNFKFPDSTFSSQTVIKSDNGAMMATLLDSPGIRSLIMNLFSESQHVTLDDHSGWMELHSNHFADVNGAAAHVRRLARTVRGIYDRAIKTGLLLQKKAA